MDQLQQPPLASATISPRPSSSTYPPASPRQVVVKRPTRKIFNCIVDDSALVAGVKRSTRNGIRQWVRNGQIRLFVPLHALEELSRQKNGKNKHSDDVRDTLQWLDEATTKHPDFVGLQGADETYEKWAEVERFSVPRTLFSEHNHEFGDDVEPHEQSDVTVGHLSNDEDPLEASLSSQASDLHRSVSPSSVNSLRSSISALSPPTSPAKADPSEANCLLSRTSLEAYAQSSSDSVPLHLQPLLNYILWRIHQELDPVAALESFIFLCNDPRKVIFAKGFDIKVKRLEQLRDAVGREDRDFRNRQALMNRESSVGNSVTSGNEAGEEAAVAATRSSPPQAHAAIVQPQRSNVMDPDAFGRRPDTSNSIIMVEQPNGTPHSPRGNHRTAAHRPPQALSTPPFMPRGGARDASMRGAYRGAPRGRGRGRFGSTGPQREAILQNRSTVGPGGTLSGQIDPDSFARPDAQASSNGSRVSRKLWVPT